LAKDASSWKGKPLTFSFLYILGHFFIFVFTLSLFSLTLLNAGSITDYGAKQLLSKMKHLSQLTLTYSHAISDQTAKVIGDRLGVQLRTLSLSNCSGFTAAGLDHMISKCLNLQLLDISHCASLPAETLVRIRKALPRCIVKYEH
jgi:hypothetical protein